MSTVKNAKFDYRNYRMRVDNVLTDTDSSSSSDSDVEAPPLPPKIEQIVTLDLNAETSEDEGPPEPKRNRNDSAIGTDEREVQRGPNPRADESYQRRCLELLCRELGLPVAVKGMFMIVAVIDRQIPRFYGAPSQRRDDLYRKNEYMIISGMRRYKTVRARVTDREGGFPVLREGQLVATDMNWNLLHSMEGPEDQSEKYRLFVCLEFFHVSQMIRWIRAFSTFLDEINVPSRYKRI